MRNVDGQIDGLMARLKGMGAEDKEYEPLVKREQQLREEKVQLLTQKAVLLQERLQHGPQTGISYAFRRLATFLNYLGSTLFTTKKLVLVRVLFPAFCPICPLWYKLITHSVGFVNLVVF